MYECKIVGKYEIFLVTTGAKGEEGKGTRLEFNTPLYDPATNRSASHGLRKMRNKLTRTATCRYARKRFRSVGNPARRDGKKERKTKINRFLPLHGPVTPSTVPCPSIPLNR